MRQDGSLVERAEGRTRVVARSEAADHVVALIRAHGSLHRAAAAGSVRALSGRGTPHVLPTPLGAWVVRRYRRGGVAGRLVEDRYLRAGTPRPLAELRVSDAARARGIPTPRVVAAMVEVAGLTVRGEIAVELVPDAADLAAVLFGAPSLAAARRGPDPAGPAGAAPVAPGAGADDPAAHAAMHAAGGLIRLLHDAGLRHPDLNLKNILIEGSAGGPPRPWVVDLDRAAVRRAPVAAAARSRMLRRFERSLRKWERAAGRSLGDPARAAFRAGYAAGSAPPRSGG